MNKLKNIKDAPMQIASLLSSNAKLCQLLIDDNPTTQLIDTSLVSLLNEHYINIYPPILSGEFNEYTRNTFIVILLNDVRFNRDNNNSVTCNIYVSTDKEHILMDNNQNRLLELSNEIINTIDNKKIAAAGELQVTSMSHFMINEFRAAYNIAITFSDQITERAEI